MRLQHCLQVACIGDRKLTRATNVLGVRPPHKASSRGVHHGDMRSQRCCCARMQARSTTWLSLAHCQRPCGPSGRMAVWTQMSWRGCLSGTTTPCRTWPTGWRCGTDRWGHAWVAMWCGVSVMHCRVAPLTGLSFLGSDMRATPHLRRRCKQHHQHASTTAMPQLLTQPLFPAGPGSARSLRRRHTAADSCRQPSSNLCAGRVVCAARG